MSLQRKTPLRAQPRSKGNRFERDTIDLLKAHGWTRARRNWQSGGQGGGDIIEGPAGVHLECKHREQCRIWQWIAQAVAEARPTDIPVVVFRRNRMEPWAALPSDEWQALAELDPRPTFSVVRKAERTPMWQWIAMAKEGASFLGPDHRPMVEFERAGSGRWTAVPAEDLFGLLRIREAA